MKTPHETTGHSSLTNVYLEQLLARCRLSIQLGQALREVVYEGSQSMKARKFNGLDDQRWDGVRSACQYNASCLTNLLGELPACTSSLSDASLKVAVKGATSVVTERLMEVSRLLDTQKKTEAGYTAVCARIESMISTNSPAQSKALQSQFNSFSVTERNLFNLTRESNQAVHSLKMSAEGWLDEVREIERRRLLMNREALEVVCDKVTEMMRRRDDVAAKSRDTFLQLQAMATQESADFERSIVPATGCSEAMEVDHILYQSSLAIDWADTCYKTFSQAYEFLAGTAHEERSYAKAVDRVFDNYGFESRGKERTSSLSMCVGVAVTGEGADAVGGKGNEATGVESKPEKRASGVEKFFNKITQGVKDLDPSVVHAKGFFEKLTTSEAPGFREAWLSVFRFLRRQDQSLLYRSETVLPELSRVLQSVESLRNDIQEACNSLQGELDGIRAKLEVVKLRREGHELTLAGAKKSHAQLQSPQNGSEQEGEAEGLPVPQQRVQVQGQPGLTPSAELSEALDVSCSLDASGETEDLSPTGVPHGDGQDPVVGSKDTLRDTGMAMMHSINKAAMKMGIKTAAEMLEESRKHVASLEAAVEKDEAEDVELSKTLQKALEKGKQSLRTSLDEYISRRRLIVADCNGVLTQAQEAVDSSRRADEKLITHLSSNFNHQTIQDGVSSFFQTCNKLAEKSAGGGHEAITSASTMSNNGRVMAQVIESPEVTFEPLQSDLIMQLRTQRLLPPLPVMDAKEKSKRVDQNEGTDEDAGMGETVLAIKDDMKEGEDGGRALKEVQEKENQEASYVVGEQANDEGAADQGEEGLEPSIDLVLVSSMTSQYNEEAKTAIWRQTDDLNASTEGSETPNSEGGWASPGSPSELAPLPSPPPSALASPTTQRKAIDMQKASRLARGVKKRSKSSIPIPVTMPSLFPKDDAILARELNLPEDQRILAYYSCCIFPQQWQLVQGTMYLTQRFVCFRGWPDTSHKRLIPMDTIDHVEKENTAVVIPNAIRLYMNNGHELLFGSYIDRDPCYDLLTASIEAEKHYSLIKAEGVSRAASMEAVTQELSALRHTASAALPSVPQSSSTSDETDNDDVNDDDTDLERERCTPVSVDDGPSSMEVHLRDVASAEDLTALGCATLGRSSGDNATSAARESPLPQQVALDLIFTHNREVTLLQNQALEVPVATVWDSCWRVAEGYSSFLHGMGDFDIRIGEWENPSQDGSPVHCPEDTSPLQFIAKRECEYKHPRTSMLVFGPKNAPAKQVQYLFLQGKGVSKFTRSLLHSHKPVSNEDVKPSNSMSGLILTVTKFDSIPMADVFKVLQYWAFEPAPNAPSSHTAVKVGFAVHYTKSSHYRSQIWAGIHEELVAQSSKWLTFASAKAEMNLRSAPVDRQTASDESSRQLSMPASSLCRSDRRRKSMSEERRAEERHKEPPLVQADANKNGQSGATARVEGDVRRGLQKEDCALVLLVLIVALVLTLMLDNRAMRAEIADYKRQLEEIQTALQYK